MILSLQLRHSTATTVAASAWFLPGNSTERWLEELTHCGLAVPATRLFIVPQSMGDRRAAGLLVVPAKTDSASRVPAGVPCRLIAGKLFIPADAVVHPPVTESEVAGLCSLPVSFFHPALGLSGFDEESTLRVDCLLQPPPEQAGDWNFAQPGAAPLPELRAVVLAQPPSIEDVFGGAPEEIGIEPPEDLPPAPDELKDNTLSKSGRALRRALAKGLAAAMRFVPHEGTRRTWLNDVEDWANRQLGGFNDQLEKIRHKELHRLLHMLATDPDAGLRHAIPMNDFAHRGMAPPSARLGSRDPSFDPARLGGRPADFWNVSSDLQALLRQRYRDMANREMQLGRHRRAAYIYAELLGDLVSAANVLKQGRHFREAALLYDEHLKDPLGAVQCLAEGGLLLEAIERYEKMERWLEVADLQERLGNRAAAEQALRRVITEHLQKDDILSATKLLDERLQANEEALELLQRAWPASRQAASCIGALFRMLARLGRHEQAIERVSQFRRELPPPNLALPLLAALREPATFYPHETVRHRAADYSRVLVAEQLGRTGLSTEDEGRLMEHLTRLAPEDRLLARDANRYLSSRREQEVRARRVTPPPSTGNKPEALRRFELPRQIGWLRLRSEWHWFYAVGVTPNRITLVRGIWEGEIQSLSWPCPATSVKNGLLFEPTNERGRAVLLASTIKPSFTEQRFPASDEFFGHECLAGTPPWLKPQHWPIAFGQDSLWTAHVALGRGIISCHDKSGRLQRTIDVTEHLLEGAQCSENTRLCLTAIDNGAAIALGNRLVLTSGQNEPVCVELPGQVTGLIPTWPHTRQGIAVMLQHGAVMHWLGVSGLIELERDIASPMGAFVPGGPLVLISEKQMVLLEIDSRGVQKVTRTEILGQRPVGVSATASPGQFAVLGAQGEMTVYSVPR